MKLCFLTLLACLLWTVADAKAEVFKSKAEVFKSKHGYRITIPNNWGLDTEPFNADVRATGPSHNDFAPQFKATILSTSSSLNTLQKIKRDSARTLPRLYQQYNLHNSFYSNIGGLTALISDESQATDYGHRARFFHAVVLRKGKTIIFTWTAMDKQFSMYKVTFEKMLDSIGWAK